MSQDIEKVMQRTQRYYYEDGLVETAVGILFFVIGVALLGWLTIQTNPILGVIMVFVSMGLIFGGTLFVQKVIPSLKARITHPRTGSVTYRRGEPSWGRWPIMLVALLIAVLGLTFPDYLSQMSVAEGVLLAAILSYIGFRVHLRRFYLLGGLALLAGVAAAFLFTFNSDITGSAFTFGVTGIFMLISGLIVLRQYLRRYPVAEADYE